MPTLLDAAHWLIENEGVSFVLCGSSARKVRRNHANLLGGRGVRFELFGLSAEGLARSLPVFGEFLALAALSDGS